MSTTKGYDHKAYIESNKKKTFEPTWVRQVDGWYSKYPAIFKTKYLINEMYYGVEENIYDIDAIRTDVLEPWKPKKGEWVWSTGRNRTPILTKFVGEKDGMYRTIKIENADPVWTRTIEPFIGQLPSGL